MGSGSVSSPTRLKGIFAALVCLWLLGLAVRALLAWQLYPMAGGDPLYSYTYRAVLIAAGRREGVFLMWHTPGYPLLLAGLTALSGGIVRPYLGGVLVSLAAYSGLFWVVDRLVAPRVRLPATRLVVGSFVALYETLFVWATSPLTEPVYLLLLYGSLALVDRERPGGGRVLGAGMLLGAAATVRLEAVVPGAGLGLFLVLRALLTEPARFRVAARTAVLFGAGWLLVAGWLVIGHWDYLQTCRQGYAASYTVPPANGLRGLLLRPLECLYVALTVWLPYTLLLPYWVLVGAGLLHRARGPGRPALHGPLLAVVLPTLVAVAVTVMVKRTGSFLLPAAAIWTGLGVEVLVRHWLAGRPRLVPLALACAIALNVGQAGRALLSPRDEAPPREHEDAVAAQLLRETGAARGPVWAFGSEPDIYALLNWPIVYPFFDRDREYNTAYTGHEGQPESFVAELRRRGFRYLVFSLARTGPGDAPVARQPFTGHGPPPWRADLEGLAARPGPAGLEEVGRRPAQRDTCVVYVFRILQGDGQGQTGQ
jgi:hypothetical protein